jgi:hypothetical protein
MRPPGIASTAGSPSDVAAGRVGASAAAIPQVGVQTLLFSLFVIYITWKARQHARKSCITL